MEVERELSAQFASGCGFSLREKQIAMNQHPLCNIKIYD